MTTMMVVLGMCVVGACGSAQRAMRGDAREARETRTMMRRGTTVKVYKTTRHGRGALDVYFEYHGVNVSGGGEWARMPTDVRVNGVRCARVQRVMDEDEDDVERKGGATCVAIIPNGDVNVMKRRVERVVDFERRVVDGRESTQVWLATTPPMLLVDQTQNHRHAIALLERSKLSKDVTTISSDRQLEMKAVLLGILDRCVNDQRYEESADMKAFVIVDDDDKIFRDEILEEPASALVEPPRGGSAQLFLLDASASQTWGDIIKRRARLFVSRCCVGVSRSSFRFSSHVGNALESMSLIRSPELEPTRHIPPVLSRNCSARGFPYADDVILEFTREQRQTFDDYRSFYKGSYEDMMRSKVEFPLAVSFDEGRSLRAKAKFRGVSSFRDCQRRKSLSVTLRGDGVRLMTGSLGTKFLLVSMCYDDRYVKTFLVLSMAKKLGLFPLAFRYVRLKVRTIPGGQTEHEGLYLMMDDPKASLLRDHNDLNVVVRRRFDPARGTKDPKSVPDVNAFPDTEFNGIAARVRYEKIVLTSETCDALGTACFNALNELLDVDGYLRWLALNTWVHSGDYVDELWLHASNEIGNPRFELNAWDPDDAFESCHHNGEDALIFSDSDAKSDLLYCAEGAIDRVLLRSPYMFERYLEQLNFVLREGIKSDALRAIVKRQETQLRNLLTDKDNATALALLELLKINPSISNASEALDEILGSLNYYETLVNARRRNLLRNPIAYAAWDKNFTTRWLAIPRTSNNSKCSVDVEVQTRSYGIPRQELMIRVSPRSASFALNISFNPNVIYEGVPYAALPEEFVFEFWSNASSGKVPETQSDVETMAKSTTTDVETATCVRSYFGRNYAFENYVIVNFSCEQVDAPLFSIHHRFWHSFSVDVMRSMTVFDMFGCE